MSSFNFSGLGSGLDINGLIGQLLAAERAAPSARLNRTEARANTQLSALGSFQSAATALKNAAEALGEAAGKPAFRAQGATDAPFKASAGPKAQPGRYEIEVLALASAEKLAAPVMAADAQLGAGQLRIQVGEDALLVDIAAGESTLAGIRDAINAASGDDGGVRATLVHGQDGSRLVLSGTRTGAAQTITVEAEGGGLQALSWDGEAGGMARMQAAADAHLRVDGMEVRQTGNRLEEVIDGVTLDLDRALPGETHALTVSRDSAPLAGALDAFVKAYNSAMGMVASLGRYDAATDTAAPLQGDAALRGFGASLRGSVGMSRGGEDLSTLSQLGVTMQTDGRLAFDRAAFVEAEAKAPAAVAALLGGDGGLARDIARIAGAYADSDGVIASRRSALDTRLERVARDREVLDRRLEGIEQRLRRQFTALDSLLGQLQSNANFLQQQIAALTVNR